MSTCPSCGSTLPDGASFCKHCGTALEQSCPNCETTVPASANFCPNCRAELDRQDSPNRADTDSAFRLKPHEFGRRLLGSDLDVDGLLGWLTRKKEISIEAGNEALFLEEGEIVERLGPGKHELESLMQRIKERRREQEPTIILLETRDTVVTIEEEVRTAGEYSVAVQAELVVTIEDPIEFTKSLLLEHDDVTDRTFQRLLGSPIRDDLEATLSNYDREALYGNRDLKRTVQQDVIQGARDTLNRYGLKLVSLRSLSFADDQDHLREGRKEVEIRKQEEDIKDEEARLDRRERERETDDVVHEENQRVRRETAEQSADHEIETQAIEQDHEVEDKKRRHEHKAEREEVEHEEETKTTRKEKEVERRDLEHEQDVSEMEDLMDLKKRKDMDGLDVEEREAEIEMRQDEHDVEMEKERLDARDEVDLATLVSLDSIDEAVAELAEIEKAEDLTPEQLEALGAKDSDELAKVRQEAHNAEAQRERVEDQKEFREELKDVSEDSMDRMQETTESAMDNMGETGQAAAEDTSDNVIVSDTGREDSGDTTIVQGGSGQSGSSGDAAGSGDTGGGSETIACPGCGRQVDPADDFCLDCGQELGGD